MPNFQCFTEMTLQVGVATLLRTKPWLKLTGVDKPWSIVKCTKEHATPYFRTMYWALSYICKLVRLTPRKNLKKLLWYIVTLVVTAPSVHRIFVYILMCVSVHLGAVDKIISVVICQAMLPSSRHVNVSKYINQYGSKLPHNGT